MLIRLTLLSPAFSMGRKRPQKRLPKMHGAWRSWVAMMSRRKPGLTGPRMQPLPLGMVRPLDDRRVLTRTDSRYDGSLPFRDRIMPNNTADKTPLNLPAPY